MNYKCMYSPRLVVLLTMHMVKWNGIVVFNVPQPHLTVYSLFAAAWFVMSYIIQLKFFTGSSKFRCY